MPLLPRLQYQSRLRRMLAECSPIWGLRKKPAPDARENAPWLTPDHR